MSLFKWLRHNIENPKNHQKWFCTEVQPVIVADFRWKTAINVEFVTSNEKSTEAMICWNLIVFVMMINICYCRFHFLVFVIGLRVLKLIFLNLDNYLVFWLIKVKYGCSFCISKTKYSRVLPLQIPMCSIHLRSCVSFFKGEIQWEHNYHSVFHSQSQ